MHFFIAGYFFVGLLLAFFYDTWFIALGVGGICLLAYYSVKILLPASNLYQYVLSAVFGVFMAQFIYQMHGLFEIHFFAFISSAILITYQNWKLQMPLLVVVFLHHAIFSYLQNVGIANVYFTQLAYFDMQTFAIHISLTIVIMMIGGLWAYQLKKYGEVFITQSQKMSELQKEAQLSIERKHNTEVLTGLNNSLQNQARALARSNEELEQFAYVASHDLQEPLRMVSSFMAKLEEKYGRNIDEKGKQYMHFAIDGATRMRQIIMDLLDFSRVGRTEDKLEKISVQDIVVEIMGFYRKQILETNAVIKYSNLPVLTGFKGPLRQIFQNLIGNALKYQVQGNTALVEISAMEKESYWRFIIRDNGIGIAHEDFERIFIIFQRLHSKSEYPGTGMGLAITKKIVENLGGKIWVESNVNLGSKFYLDIPKISQLLT
ncbi:ATP-binding protein [Mucilaginibacter calamicampi]|uniref:histidine kinase n=1 Tax=Mucilaginibacter calamicampi TaxID=1302352 RepID=A0ABW2Z0M5_9SPHI